MATGTRGLGVSLALQLILASTALASPSGHGMAAGSAGSTGSTFVRQFGTQQADEAQDVAVDAAGHAHVVGFTFGSLPGQKPAGGLDAFVRKYDPTGGEVWTHQFGSWERDYGHGVAVDDRGHVYVVGMTHGTLDGQRTAGGFDAFVRRYDPSGSVVWTRQFGGGGGELASAVALDGAGQAYVVGSTRGTLPGLTSAGDWDAFVRKYDVAGNELWTRQFGSPRADGIRRAAVDRQGGVWVGGTTEGALPGGTAAGGQDVFVRRYDPAGAEQWTGQFGSAADDFGLDLAVDGTGRVCVVGSSDRFLPGQASAGGTDAFIRLFDFDGESSWTHQFGTSAADEAWGVAVDRAGNTYVAGRTDSGLAPGGSAGGADAFVRRYDPSGREVWTRQFGSAEDELALAVHLNGAGQPYVAGGTTGTLPGQTSSGWRDAYVVRLE